MKAINLYDITSELAELENALIESGGAISDEMEERYHELLDANEQKARGYIAVIRRLEATAGAVEAERKRLHDNEKALKNSAQALKDRLAESMLRRGEDCYETDLGKIRLQQASKRSLVVKVDESILPDRFRIATVKANKRSLREALEAGDEEAAEFCEFDEPSRYVRIY